MYILYHCVIFQKKTEDPGENKIKGDYDKNKIEDNQDKNKTHFKILVWRFGNWAKRKYVNGYTSKENDVFATCEVRYSKQILNLNQFN